MCLIVATPCAIGLPDKGRHGLQEEFRSYERYMRYCRALRERRPAVQRAILKQQLGLSEADILQQEPWAGVLRPSHVLVRDVSTTSIILAVRGTHSMKVAIWSSAGLLWTHLCARHKQHTSFSAARVMLATCKRK